MGGGFSFMTQEQNRGNVAWKNFGRRAGMRAGIPSVISAPGDFHGMISMESPRADCYQSHFSIALFEVGTSSENSVLIRRLVRTLHNPFRNIE